MGNTKEYVIHPFIAGECSIDKFESEEIVVIDITTREEIVYCDPGCYLITKSLLDTFIENNVDCVNIITHEDLKIKFSVKHNMKYPNKKIQEWYRMIPFPKDSGGDPKEIYLNENNELIINERVFNLLKDKEHWLERALIEKYEDEHEAKIIEEEKAKPVFITEKNNTMKQIIIFSVIMSVVAYWFFL
ncbi:hypothetical protein C0N38_004296 [Salmonella enterica subsp. enterica serovar Oranienburg]|nr:hypothetical protein [Salmonella enterica subsp. enterica serovar Oranienburg]